MSNGKKKSLLLWCLKAFLVISILLGTLFLTLHIFRTDVIRYGGEALGYTVSVEEARLFYQEGSVGFRMETLTIKELTEEVRAFQTDELRLLLSPILTTLFKDFHIAELSLKRPHLVLAFPEEEAVEVKEKAGEVKKEEIPSPAKPLHPLEIRKTIIEDGQVTIKFLSGKRKTEKPAETIFPVKNIFLLASIIQSPTEKVGLRIKADRLSCSTLGGEVTAEGSIDIFYDETLAYAFNINANKLHLEQIIQTFYPELADINGEATVAGTVKSGKQKATNVQVDKLSLASFGGKIEAKGMLNVLADETVAYSFDVKGNQLSLGQLAETFYPELTGLKGKGTIEGQIRSGEQGAIDIQLTNLFLTAFEGELHARGKLNIPPDGAPAYSLDFDTKDLKIEQIHRALKVESNDITGATTLTGHIENSGHTEPAVAGLNGQFSFSLNNGTVKQFGILGKIFHLLSPTAYLKGEIPDLTANGFRYNSITGALAIKDGVGNLDETVLKSASWNIITKGDLDFVKQEMDLDIYIQMIQTVDTVVSWVPVVGHILKDKNRGLLDIYFKAKGKMNDPQVEYKPITNLADQVWGILKRTLTLPLQLIPEKKPAPATDAPQ